jgi:hypothetical protein
VRRYALVDVAAFRNERLVTFGFSTVSAFTLRRPGRSMRWIRDGNGGWSTEREGRTIEGRKRYVEAIVRYLQGARVSEFVPADQIETVAPLDAPRRTIEVETSDGSHHAVAFGRRLAGRVYARARSDGPDAVSYERYALADTSILEIFDSTVDDLRDRRLLRVDTGRVRKLEVVTPNLRITLVRPGGEWGFPNPALGAVDQRKARRALDATAELEYDRVLDENGAARGSYGLSDPAIRITMYGNGGELLDELVCSPRAGETDGFAVSSRSSGVVGEAGRSGVEALVDAYRDLGESAGGSNE